MIIILSTFHLAPLSKKNLTLFKYKDDDELIQKFRLVNEVNLKWREMVRLLDRNSFIAEVECLFRVNNNPTECWQMVTDGWLQQGTDAYPSTWEGMYEWLGDVHCAEVAENLKKAVESYVPDASPQVLLASKPVITGKHMNFNKTSAPISEEEKDGKQLTS